MAEPEDWQRMARAQLCRRWKTVFQEFDVVLRPPFLVLAFPHDRTEDAQERRVDIDGALHLYLSLIVWATMAPPPALA
jgi:amidase